MTAKRKRDWNRIKGFRKKGVQVAVLISTAEECVVFHGKRKISFTCNVPLERELKWQDVQGQIVDDRARPELARGFESMRLLTHPGKQAWHEAKSAAFSVIKVERAKKLALKMQPTFFHLMEKTAREK